MEEAGALCDVTEYDINVRISLQIKLFRKFEGPGEKLGACAPGANLDLYRIPSSFRSL